MATYLFYDIETSGLNKAFDQILQFAAIRTDRHFNEIDRHEVHVRLRPDVIISPLAMATHMISVADAHQGDVEYEAIQQIHDWLNTPGTISIGYNSLGFDDEFLRFAFYRNLLPPYTHQYNNGCSRMDVLPMTVVYRLYKSDILQWPEVDGKPSLKLEYLNDTNKLFDGRAHDALSDVETTLALARTLSREVKIWQFLNDYFDKAIERKRTEKLPEAFQTAAGIHRKGIMISHKVGAEANYQAPVLYIGDSVPYKNQTLWLRLDLPELQQTTSETLSETTWVKRKRFGEPPFILPPLARYSRRLRKESMQLAKENLRWLSANPKTFLEIVHYHQHFRYPDVPNLDTDSALYQMGFLSRSEEKLCRRFHAADLHHKAELIETFSKPETRELARRILFRNYPEALSEPQRNYSEQYLRRINPQREDDALVDYRGEKRVMPAAALKEIEQIRHEGTLQEKK
ncbi:MAG: exodeoxyribonuclease I, partial [Deltaproteobacteria bacterium]|nr:exodeoxyribonuclease I [Deltaproteobacteria bacterium]